MKIRTLKANEIEIRIGQINEKGATLLLYKDARCDMNLLDETGKPWKREHQLIDGKLFCTVSIWNSEIEQWEPRQDVGTESNQEATKGEASDSFKRACFNWGIGRELYSAPFIWIPADRYDGKKNPKTGKYSTYDKFSVTHIEYDDNREISQLAIQNDNTKQPVFNNMDTTQSGFKKLDKSKNDLLKSKSDLRKALANFGHDNDVKMKVVIKTVLQKPTVDTVAEANEVMQALEDGLV